MREKDRLRRIRQIIIALLGISVTVSVLITTDTLFAVTGVSTQQPTTMKVIATVGAVIISIVYLYQMNRIYKEKERSHQSEVKKVKIETSSDLDKEDIRNKIREFGLPEHSIEYINVSEDGNQYIIKLNREERDDS